MLEVKQCERDVKRDPNRRKQTSDRLNRYVKLHRKIVALICGKLL